MKNLYEAARVEEVKQRVARLRPNSERLWGSMTAAQMVAHCATSMEWAVGDKTPPRMFVGRIIGRMVKQKVVGNDEPMRRNSPTTKDLVGRAGLGNGTRAIVRISRSVCRGGCERVHDASA